MTEFKRMNFFTGFFTTADDWNNGQAYHIEKLKLHNRGLHTPGVIRGVDDELQVEAAGGLNVRILPGAALDSHGNEIYLAQARTLKVEVPKSLPQKIYITIQYAEEPTNWVENVQAPEYSGNTLVVETPKLMYSSSEPDNQEQLELARIDLQEGVTEITKAADTKAPVGNEINRCHVAWSGSVSTVEQLISEETQERVIQEMRETRNAFVPLQSRFPVPSVPDVRHAALAVQLLASVDSLRSEHVANVLKSIADVEQAVCQELSNDYPALKNFSLYRSYYAAVESLQTSLLDGQAPDTLLTRQHQVAIAARELSKVVTRPPEAIIVGDDELTKVIPTKDEECLVTLDASKSQAHAYDGEDQVTVQHYHWKRTV